MIPSSEQDIRDHQRQQQERDAIEEAFRVTPRLVGWIVALIIIGSAIVLWTR